MCILTVYCSDFLNWVYWARGNFFRRAGSHTYWRFVRLRCGVPGRYEYIWLLRWSGWRAGTGFLSTWLSFGVCSCDLTGGGVAGQYDFSSIFCFVLAGQYD